MARNEETMNRIAQIVQYLQTKKENLQKLNYYYFWVYLLLFCLFTFEKLS